MMKFRDILRNNPFTIALILVSTLICGITFVFSEVLAIAELVVVLFIVVFAIKWISKSALRKKEFLRSVEANLSESGESGRLTGSFPFPLLLVNNKGDIQWFNSAFHQLIDGFEDSYSDNVFSFLPVSQDILSKTEYDSFEISTSDKKYTVWLSRVEDELVAMYFVDDTILKDIRTQFTLTRPSVLLVNIDSLEHTEEAFDHADYYSVVSDVEKIITKWLVDNKCVFRKSAEGKFFALTESKNLDEMIKRNFEILDKIRNFRFNEQELDITLSVGVGREKMFSECEVSARQALDMARGRGGDQVAVKCGENYEFFGGHTSRKEKRGKIKSRIISAALYEYIEKCDTVFVMGHTYSDFDAVGAAVGIAAIARSCSKKAYVVVNRKLTLARPLIELIENSENNRIRIISPEKAEELFSENSLLVITDTMRSRLVEAPELLKRAENIILIDHHRKTVDYIDNAVLAFHEPYASSACEMVTELAQYSPSSVKLTPCEAQALLSGIILDTKNFALRVGVRTFEAAAYLKDCKADTVKVKKLFSGTVDENVSVSKLIASASFYDHYAVTVASADDNVSRLITSKTADELLNIEGVDASFVVSSNNETVFISARSLGLINVQLIMEEFGGGGHQSMAACQIPGDNVDDAVQKLHNVVKKYIEKNLS